MDAKRQREEKLFCKDPWLQVLNKVWTWDHLRMFHLPVRDEDVPGYSASVETPMDLSTIRTKLNQGNYRTDEEVEEDFYLMITNALQFNEIGSLWHSHAKKLKRQLPSFLKECDLSNLEDGLYVPSGEAQDVEKTIEHEEKRGTENISATIQGMEDDLNIPLEVLIAQYKSAEAQQMLQKRASHSSGSSSSSSSSRSSEHTSEEAEESSSVESSLS